MNQIIVNSTETFVEGIRLISRPLDTDQGVKPLTPFVLSVSADTSNYEDLVVDLYASNSNSIPYTSQLDNNWSALKPQWRFLDIDGSYLEEHMPIVYDTEVVDEDGNVRGGVGSATFYYVDDLPSDSGVPIMLQCTLNTLNYYDIKYRGTDDSIVSFYNSNMKTIIPFQVYPINPAFIHFSQNGSLELYNTQWAGNNIHSYVTINGIPRNKFIDYTACSVDYPIIFNSPAYPSHEGTNILEYLIYPLLESEMSPSGTPSAEFLPFEMSSGVVNGGWTSVDATSWVETSGAIMVGNVDIQYDDADITYTNTSAMWVSNRTANMIHKLETIYIDTSNPAVGDFYNGNSEYINNNVYSTGFNVPFYDVDYYNHVDNYDILTNIHELSGYSGVYGVAIDGDDNVWTVDFELDRIYKRDSAGVVLFTVDLQKVSGMPAHYADSEYTWYGPSSISLDREGNAYVTLYNSPSTMKITVTGDIDFFFKPNAVPATTPPASSDEGTYYRPVDVEVGSSGDIHVLYSNTNKAALVHYDSAGTQVGPSWSSTGGFRPVDMVYVNNGSSEVVYTTNIGINAGPTSNAGGVYKYVWNGSGYEPRTVIGRATNAGYITTDGSNIFFSYDNNKIGVLTDTDTIEQDSFLNFEITTELSGIDIIGGLTCDESGFLNIIDTYQNVIYRQSITEFLTTGIATPYGIKVNPDENYTLIKTDVGEIIKIDATTDELVASLQAHGDWTGMYWRSKFGSGELPAAYGTSPKKAPYLILPDDNTTMDVLWQLDATATSTIEWGFNTYYTEGSQVTSEYGADHQHKYTITGLVPDTRYYYRVVGLGSGSFKSPPSASSTAVKFLAYGDTRSNPSDQNSVINGVVDTYLLDPDNQTLILHVGDWVNVDAETDWQEQMFPTDQEHLVRFKKDISVLGCRGNHETYNNPNSDVYLKYFPYTYEAVNTFYRSFDYGPLHVVIVDQYTDYSTGSAQYNWLEADLAASTKPHKIIVLHEPGWSAGSHPNNTDVQNYIQPLCLTHGVKIVLGGHNHFYSRCEVDGVQHLTIGGGGAPLYTPVVDDPAYPYVESAGAIHHFAKFNIVGSYLQVDIINTDSVNNDVFDTFATGEFQGQGTNTVTLSGSSAPFKIKSFNSDYDLRRFNDSWDMHEQIRSYVIPDYQKQFTDLWDDLIGNTVGNDGSNYQTFGRQFYEKIANFVLNHSDMDLANISQVYSLFSSLALDYTNYDFKYPADLGHWMNILSITFERLRGDQFQCNRNFKPKRYETIEDCEVCGQIHDTNMGDKILNPVMVEGEPVVIRDTYLMRNAFDVFYPPLDGDYQQLSDYYGFRSPFNSNYEVFEYIPTVSPNVQSEGFINWDDSHNDLAISGISAKDWWGDSGYVEEIFTQVLYNGLGVAVDYITEEQAQLSYGFNLIGEDLTSDNTTIIDDGLVISEYIIPVKSTGCAPIAGFGIPFYTTSQTISGPAINFGYPTSGIADGLIESDLYVKIEIGSEVYYAPSYIITPLILPIVGSGITFKDGFVRPEYVISSSGFLVFNNDGDTVLLPVYK